MEVKFARDLFLSHCTRLSSTPLEHRITTLLEITKLVEELNYLPLAIVWAASYLQYQATVRPVAKFIKDLQTPVRKKRIRMHKRVQHKSKHLLTVHKESVLQLDKKLEINHIAQLMACIHPRFIPLFFFDAAASDINARYSVLTTTTASSIGSRHIQEALSRFISLSLVTENGDYPYAIYFNVQSHVHLVIQDVYLTQTSNMTMAVSATASKYQGIYALLICLINDLQLNNLHVLVRGIVFC